MVFEASFMVCVAAAGGFVFVIAAELIVTSDLVAAKSGIIRDIHIGETVMGYPAISVSKYLKNYKKTMIDS